MKSILICLILLFYCGGNPFIDDFGKNKLEFSRCNQDGAILFMDSSLTYNESDNNYVLEFLNQTYRLQLQKSYSSPSPYLVKYESYNDLPTQEFVLYKTIIDGVAFDFKGYTCLE
jgi:Uma2 family endonuclease